jgi:hypothetical protein
MQRLAIEDTGATSKTTFSRIDIEAMIERNRQLANQL